MGGLHFAEEDLFQKVVEVVEDEDKVEKNKKDDQAGKMRDDERRGRGDR
jgi:hypothetical protein